MVREVGGKLFEARLASPAQALGPIVREPGLYDMPVCNYEPIANVETGSHEFILRNGCMSLRSKGRRVVAVLNGAAAFVCLRFRIAQRASGTWFDEIK